MKKLLILSLILLLSISCSNDNNRFLNPYLPNIPVNVTINLNFAQYNALTMIGGTAIIYGHGTGGMDYGAIIVHNLNGVYFSAYDLMCPNHKINTTCSRMTQDKPNAIFVTCHCINEHNELPTYNATTGTSITQGGMKEPMKRYNVEQKGNMLRVWY